MSNKLTTALSIILAENTEHNNLNVTLQQNVCVPRGNLFKQSVPQRKTVQAEQSSINVPLQRNVFVARRYQFKQGVPQMQLKVTNILN